MPGTSFLVEIKSVDFSLDYIPSGYGSTKSDGMQRLEQDVKDASKNYAAAEEAEDLSLAKLARFQGIKAGLIAATSEDDDLLAEGETKLEKEVEKAGNKRRKLHSKLEKRIKTRDAAADLKNENADKKEGQIYFDGMLYTARWSCLPA